MNDLEKQLRNQSLKEEVYIDTETLWNQVEPKLKKKRRRLLPFFLLIGLTIMVSGIVYNYPFKQTEIANNQSMRRSNSDITNNKESTQNKKEILAVNLPERSFSSTNIISEKNKTISNKIKSEAIPIRVSSTRKNTSSSPTAIYTALNGTKTSEATLQNNTKEIALTNKITKEGLSTTTLRYERTLIKPIDNISIPLNAIYKNEISALALSIPVIESSFSNYSNLVERNSSIAFFLSGGMSQSPINLQLQNSEWQNHFSNRKSSESSLLSFHLRTGITKEIKHDLILKAGLTYSKLNRKSNSTLVIDETIVLNDVLIEKIVGPNGTEDVFGSLTVQQTTTQIVERIIKSSSIDLNLSLLKQFQIGNNLKFNIGPQLSYNLQYTQSGKIHPNSNEEYDLSIDKNEWFESNNGLSLGLETGIQYPLNYKTSITAGILYDYKLSGINTKAYGVMDKRNALHIGIGIHQSF